MKTSGNVASLEAIDELYQVFAKERVLTTAISRYAFASDAGPYLLIPRAVLQPINELEVQAILSGASKHSCRVSSWGN